ncbi:uncharacterized protein EI90DRAFT_2987771 [Cantharellus anzutake]|uniref:uncharacterized protein n=1 Tax=Cantharellus anzutake TaxID=1750568 RepID=UPI0019068947|nr:uncharacterized protein EI90DRAFT_2987771 [Cantharellus anzutake]KAF8342599.1 hypothetical protein EI90DRAFT_2987771 [Cantharellus anzutake]
MSSKLNLKQTPQEAEDRARRQAQRAARRESPRLYRNESPSSRQHHRSRRPHRDRSASSTHPTFPGPSRHARSAAQSASYYSMEEEDLASESYEPRKTVDDLRAEAEEAYFRSKLFNAMADDERLEALEASFNSHAHTPHRWGSPVASSATANDSAADINAMSDEEYAEWIRRGMWRRTHREEVEAEARKQEEKKRKKERERAARKAYGEAERRKETRRAAKRAEEKALARREAGITYQSFWSELQARAAAASSTSDQFGADPPFLTFSLIPWPVFELPEGPETITREAVSEFLLSDDHSPGRTHKQRIREALLAYHPDRFVGRYISLVEASHQKAVEEGVGRVVRILNDMLEGLASR